MSALRAALRRVLGWRHPARAAPPPAPDPIGEHLRAAIEADACAKAANIKTCEARVASMIDDFFAKYGDRDGCHFS